MFFGNSTRSPFLSGYEKTFHFYKTPPRFVRIQPAIEKNDLSPVIERAAGVIFPRPLRTLAAAQMPPRRRPSGRFPAPPRVSFATPSPPSARGLPVSRCQERLLVSSSRPRLTHRINLLLPLSPTSPALLSHHTQPAALHIRPGVAYVASVLCFGRPVVRDVCGWMCVHVHVCSALQADEVDGCGQRKLLAAGRGGLG